LFRPALRRAAAILLASESRFGDEGSMRERLAAVKLLKARLDEVEVA
jgi:hypothetical protein